MERAHSHTVDVENETLAQYVVALDAVERALEQAGTVDEVLSALEQSADVFGRFVDDLEFAGEPVYATASELFLEFRRRAYTRLAVV